MAAAQVVVLIQFGVPAWRVRRDKVCAHTRSVVRERTTDDLLYFTFVQIDAGSEHRVKLKRQNAMSKDKM